MFDFLSSLKNYLISIFISLFFFSFTLYSHYFHCIYLLFLKYYFLSYVCFFCYNLKRVNLFVYSRFYFILLQPTKRLWIRKSYPKNLSIKSDFLFIIVITLSFLISLSYRYINQMQCFIKILIRIADYICKIS